MPEQPRLGIFAPFKAWGGIERKIVTLCREFLAAGVRPRLILTRGSEVPYPDNLPTEVEIVDLHSRRKIDAIVRLRQHLLEQPVSALLTAKDHAAKAAIIARMSGVDVPVYIKVTNTLSQTLRRPGKRWTARWLYAQADGIIANSSGVADDLRSTLGLSPGLLHVIHNPTVTSDFPQRASQPVHHPWFNEDVPVVVAAGRLTPQKDFSTLLNAFQRARRDRRMRLVFLGDGAGLSGLKHRADQLGVSNDVDFPGSVDDPLPYMAKASGFVLSSRYEGLPNVLIEAMAVGTPVVATDCPSGPREILENGAHCPLVPVGDVEALATGITRILDDPVPAAQLMAACDRFHSGRIAQQYVQTLGLF